LSNLAKSSGRSPDLEGRTKRTQTHSYLKKHYVGEVGGGARFHIHGGANYQTAQRRCSPGTTTRCKYRNSSTCVSSAATKQTTAAGRQHPPHQQHPPPHVRRRREEGRRRPPPRRSHGSRWSHGLVDFALRASSSSSSAGPSSARVPLRCAAGAAADGTERAKAAATATPEDKPTASKALAGSVATRQSSPPK
jgi:hypothetical protein